MLRCLPVAPRAHRLTHPSHSVPAGRQVDWDKGTALAHLLELLGLADPDRVFCLYIGDDRTDEDAFKGEGAVRGAWARACH